MNKMHENNETDPESNAEVYLSHWEKKCIDEWDKEALLDDRIQAETERSAQRLWTSFQNSASSISHLYKGNLYGKL